VDERCIDTERFTFEIQQNGRPCGVFNVADKWIHVCKDSDTDAQIYSIELPTLRNWLSSVSKEYLITQDNNKWYEVPTEVFMDFVSKNKVKVINIEGGIIK
jgi:uncharacterized protein with WD repeat